MTNHVPSDRHVDLTDALDDYFQSVKDEIDGQIHGQHLLQQQDRLRTIRAVNLRCLVPILFENSEGTDKW